MVRLSATSLAVVAFLGVATSGVASAQQADPYANAAQEERLRQYKALREDYLKQVEYLYWAYGCQVLPNECNIAPVLNGIAAGMDETIIDMHVAGMRADAARRGMAKASGPGGCAYWHDHPDEVVSVRQRAQAAIR